MNNADWALENFKKTGYLSWDFLREVMHVKNPPDVIYKLRSKGHRIESVWEEKNGKRHVKAYRYYSKGAL